MGSFSRGLRDGFRELLRAPLDAPSAEERRAQEEDAADDELRRALAASREEAAAAGVRPRGGSAEHTPKLGSVLAAALAASAAEERVAGACEDPEGAFEREERAGMTSAL